MASIEAVERVLGMLDAAGLVQTGTPRDRLTRDEIDLRVTVYVDVLSDLPNDDVLAAARCWLRKSRFFPTPGDLHSEARPAVVVTADSTTEAAQAYQRTLECNTYTPEAGARWSYRQIAAEVGQAAADAFIAAGGHEAFAAADPVGDQFRFKRFVAAYVEALQARGAEARMLSAGGTARGISAGDAAGLVAAIAGRLEPK